MLTNAGELAEVFDRDFGVTLPVDPAEVWDRLAFTSQPPDDELFRILGDEVDQAAL